MPITKRILHYLLLAIFLIGIPFLCASLGNKQEILEGLSQFPPRTEDWGTHPEKLWNFRRPFSWPFFFAMLGGVLLVLFPFLKRGFFPPKTTAPQPTTGTRHRFPLFGWIGLVLGIVGWILAWNRFPWFDWGQRHTYLILWAAYILVINALCIKRSGRSPMTSHPFAYFLTFPTSALFWWFFEFLNRFVWNWYYRGVAEMSAPEYAFFATCSFSTVLPAVCSTAAWLKTFRPFHDDRFQNMAQISIRTPGMILSLLALSLIGLTGIVFLPQTTYPLLWISPLCVFLLLQVFMKEESVADLVTVGDWRLFVRFALAALICGLWWETWNWHSLAKWVYAVPFVHAFQVWEMPILGFAGYLPFGIECAAVTAWIYPALVEREDLSK